MLKLSTRLLQSRAIGGVVWRMFRLHTLQRKARTNALESAADIIVGMSVQPVTGSRLVDISYSDPDPSGRNRSPTPMPTPSCASNIDKRFQANESAKIFLEDKIQQLKLRLEESEEALVAFAQKQQIVAVQEKPSIAETNLAATNAELQTLISERTKNEQLWRQSEKPMQSICHNCFPTTLISGLRSKRDELELEYQEKLQTFKPGYPAMVQISNKIKEIDDNLRMRLKTIKDSLKAAYELTLAQENALTYQGCRT